jgi:hypothetical protein
MNFDNEVLAYLSNRKDQLIEAHEEYIMNHQEIREVLNDFLSSVLLNKPVGNITKLMLNHRNLLFEQHIPLISETITAHFIFRMMYSCSLRSTSAHSIQHH